MFITNSERYIPQFPEMIFFSFFYYIIIIYLFFIPRIVSNNFLFNCDRQNDYCLTMHAYRKQCNIYSWKYQSSIWLKQNKIYTVFSSNLTSKIQLLKKLKMKTKIWRVSKIMRYHLIGFLNPCIESSTSGKKERRWDSLGLLRIEWNICTRPEQ